MNFYIENLHKKNFPKAQLSESLEPISMKKQLL
jgi:hypothetical protein